MTSKADRLNSEDGGQSLLGIRWLLAGVGAVLISAAVSVASGPVSIPLGQVVRELLDHLPLLEVDSSLSAADRAIIWDLRAPRVVLGLLVGALLAGSGAAYQGVFRNPLADPYLLGIAAGAGLGATIARVEGQEVFRALAERYPDLELKSHDVEYQESIVFRSVKSLPVSLD